MSHSLRLFLLSGFAFLVGHGNSLPAAEPKAPVVVYTALDRGFSEPILMEFEKRSGRDVLPVYDTEATKTVGLVNRLLAERAAPRADVFWNNEILRSIQLKKEGLTAAYVSPSASTIPAHFKDPDGHWTGFAARARVFLWNTKRLGDRPAPSTFTDLVSPAWKGDVAFAKPLFGTTNTHFISHWAAEETLTRTFWGQLFDNGVMEAGNAQARDAVVRGEVTWCLTDTDDAFGAIADGAPVAMGFPTSDLHGPGTLLIPNTLVLLANSPNPEGGKELIDFLLTEEVEGLLAKSRSAQIPVRESVAGPSGLPPLTEAQILAVDWEKTHEAIAPAGAWLRENLSTRQ